MSGLFRGRFSIAVAVVITAAGVTGYALAAAVNVSLTASGPQPRTATAALGDTVTFVNHDAVNHTVVASRHGLSSPPIAPGQGFAYVVTNSGRIQFAQDDRPTLAGEIVVARVGSVTLRTGRRSVAFGSGTVLMGTTSLPAFAVAIERKPPGERRWEPFGTAQPAADGSFSLPLEPERSASYRANVLAGELLSSDVQIAVRPVVRITAPRRSAPTGVIVPVIARVNPTTSARSVELMKYDARRQRWRSVLTRRIVGGKATFRWRVEHGRSLFRVTAARRGLVEGFAEGSSVAVRITGTGAPPRRRGR